MGRGIIKYIDIHDTNNGHIEIDDRMKPMHDYPRGGEGSHNIEFSYNHYPPEVRVFFSREHRKNAREHFRKFAREHFCFARELSKKNLPVNPRKSP